MNIELVIENDLDLRENSYIGFYFSDFKFYEDLDQRLKKFWSPIESQDINTFIESCNISTGINLSGCIELKSIPENLQNGLDLNLSGCSSLTKLPQKINVLNNLNLSGCTGLKTLPKNIYLGGSYTDPSNKWIFRD